MGLFAEWQPRYAEFGIATFPVRDKRPQVKGYLKLGVDGSRRLAGKYPLADQFGLACAAAKITVLDVDSPDEGLFADALAEFGDTPLLIRSGSGNHQAWYSNSGERRRIRPDEARPIDILGDGYVVAPPSRSASGAYTIIQGSLDDLERLPPLRHPSSWAGYSRAKKVTVGKRNDHLWQQCMNQAPFVSEFEELLAFAAEINQHDLTELLPEAEVVRAAQSAWSKEASGDNWFRRGERVVVSHREIDHLLQEAPDAFMLLLKLRRHHWGRPFVVANAMCRSMPGGGWTPKKLARARGYLEKVGELVQVRSPSRKNGPGLYRFKGSQN